MFTIASGGGTQFARSNVCEEEITVTSEERLRELEDKYEGYTVYDNGGEKIGKVDDLFVDDADREEYIGVKTGFLGTKSTLIPTEIVRVNEADRRIEVSESKERIKGAPSFDDDEDITPDYEASIRDHFGLEESRSSDRGGAYGAPSGSSSARDEVAPEEQGEQGASDRAEYEERGERTEGSGGSAEAAREGEDAASSPVTRQTEETETFEEGGRTKVRRRIVREEIIEEDA
jgi:hypothetical protein